MVSPRLTVCWLGEISCAVVAAATGGFVSGAAALVPAEEQAAKKNCEAINEIRNVRGSNWRKVLDAVIVKGFTFIYLPILARAICGKLPTEITKW